jgi:SAM-dependent methyltransferase
LAAPLHRNALCRAAKVCAGMSTDPRTIAAYNARARDYAAHVGSTGPDRHLTAFMARLPAGAMVLDLGCGPGTASAHLRAKGHLTDAIDASSAMVALANETHGLGARVASFDEVVAVAVFDGIWANFSLLHAPRADLPRHLSALHRALKPGGVLHLGMKTGAGDARDTLDRHYTYYSVDELQAVLFAAGFMLDCLFEGRERGLAGTDDPFVIMVAHA